MTEKVKLSSSTSDCIGVVNNLSYSQVLNFSIVSNLFWKLLFVTIEKAVLMIAVSLSLSPCCRFSPFVLCFFVYFKKCDVRCSGCQRTTFFVYAMLRDQDNQLHCAASRKPVAIVFLQDEKIFNKSIKLPFCFPKRAPAGVMESYACLF